MHSFAMEGVTLKIFAAVTASMASFAALVAAPGQIDPSFNANVDGTVLQLALQPDRKIVICGEFTNVNGVLSRGIARLNPDGSTDLSFRVELEYPPGTYNEAQRVAVQPDGKVLLTGLFNRVNGLLKERMARLNPDGSLDTNFNSLPYLPYSQLALQNDGKIVFGGYQGARRLNPDGSRDTNFVVTTSQFGEVDAVTIQRDGKILIGGNFTSINGFPLESIGRLNPDGTVDGSFQTAGQDLGDANRVLIELEDGSVLIGGDIVAKLAPDGRLSPDFTPLRSNVDWCKTMIWDKGNLVVGGLFTFYNVSRTNIVRLTATGAVDLSFDPEGGANDAIYSLSLQSDGRYSTGGRFTEFAAQSASHVVQLLGDQPLLTILRASVNSIILSWDAPYSNWQVQASTDLNVTNWFPVSNQCVIVSNRCFTTNPSFAPARFFRLSNP